MLGSIALVLAIIANLTGAWTLDLDPDFGGRPSTADCTFKQDGQKLVADCGDGPTISGEVEGRKVTLRANTGAKNEFTATFNGELDEKETTIHGTWQLTTDHGHSEGKFTATKR
jgi:hypothetical protein